MTKKKIGKLEIIIFTGGAVVMVLELIGSRILAPYLGTSIFVWSSLIGIILGALSLGYYLGGRFSKTKPNFNFLTQILFFSALSILIVGLVKEPALIFSMQLGIKTGSVVATLALFAVPSVLLGMVSPLAIRLKIENVENSGGVAGNLYALSTIGSIFGTFLAGFYLIPTFGSSQIIFALSLIMALISLFGNKKLLKTGLIILIIILWLINHLPNNRVILETDTAYNHITVLDQFALNGPNKKIRVLYLGNSVNSAIYHDSEELYLPYLKFYILDNLFKPEIKKGLTLGGGAYAMPNNFLKRHPQAQMAVVEIDPGVTDAARKFFDLSDNPRLKIYHQDARIFLNNNSEKYDVVYGDVFNSYYSIPFQLTTKEFMAKLYNSLEDDGVLILNLISALKGEKSVFFQAQYKTLKDIFPQIYIFPVNYQKTDELNKPQNLIIIASKNKQRLSKDDLLANASAGQKELVSQLYEGEIEIGRNIRTLTDDFAPVDYYIAKIL